VTWGRRIATGVVVAGVLALAVAGLVRAALPAARPSLQERTASVAATLRCPTCHGLSIQDSQSVLAAGARQIISRQLREGRTPDEIRQYFVDRYGQQALLAPSSDGVGVLAWLLPAVAVAGAAALAWRWTRRPESPERAAPGAADRDGWRALEAYRDGLLVPEPTPAGDALHAALLARIAAEEDGADPDLVGRTEARLGAAYRRYTARSVTAPAATATRERTATRLGALPRRALLVGSAGLVVLAGGVGIGLALHGRSANQPITGALPAAASAPANGTTATPPGGALPSAPPGYTGGMPRSADQWVTLGRAYDKAGQYPQALAAYGMALKLQPGADDVVLMRDDVLVRSGKPADALPTLTQLGAKYPDNPDVLLILGLAQNRTGDAAGTATLRKFLELAPDSPAAPGVRKLLADQ
jgi:cytochrome c-type biogenesis protein CcmH